MGSSLALFPDGLLEALGRVVEIHLFLGERATRGRFVAVGPCFLERHVGSLRCGLSHSKHQTAIVSLRAQNRNWRLGNCSGLLSGLWFCASHARRADARRCPVLSCIRGGPLQRQRRSHVASESSAAANRWPAAWLAITSWRAIPRWLAARAARRAARRSSARGWTAAATAGGIVAMSNSGVNCASSSRLSGPIRLTYQIA